MIEIIYKLWAHNECHVLKHRSHVHQITWWYLCVFDEVAYIFTNIMPPSYSIPWKYVNLLNEYRTGHLDVIFFCKNSSDTSAKNGFRGISTLRKMLLPSSSLSLSVRPWSENLYLAEIRAPRPDTGQCRQKQTWRLYKTLVWTQTFVAVISTENIQGPIKAQSRQNR